MKQYDLNTLLAKLRRVVGEMADALWLTSLLDPSQQKNAHSVAQALAAELLGEGYISEHILLQPPPRDKAAGGYKLGQVVYAGKPVCSFGHREQHLSQHVPILGRCGAKKANVACLLICSLFAKP